MIGQVERTDVSKDRNERPGLASWTEPLTVQGIIEGTCVTEIRSVRRGALRSGYLVGVSGVNLERGNFNRARRSTTV